MYQSIRVSVGTSSMAAARRGEPVVSLVFSDRKLAADDGAMQGEMKEAVAAALKRPEFGGECGEVAVARSQKGGRMVFLVGLGEASKFNAAKARAAGGAIVKALHRHGVKKASLSVQASVTRRLKADVLGRAIGEGVGLGAFVFDDFKGMLKKTRGERTLNVTAATEAVAGAIEYGLNLAESTNYARRLQATPPNVATTTRIAREATTLAKSRRGLTCSVIRGEGLEKEKLVGLINVGKASENPPCLIQLTYTPKGRSTGTVLLVGKTICYDTGGLSLKVNNGMKGMKYDKSGGMAVLGAMHAVTWLKPSCKVVALLAAAENSVSDEAYRPDDILTYRNGVTVEVTNTDAEGRLVLADALAWGCEKIKPDAIVDLATLTGGVIIALGNVCAGLFCEDEWLRGRVERAAESSGERVWRLPLWDEYRDMMRSQHADIWNSAPVREAHPIQGAAFLSYFVDPKTPWAHLDIAGTAAIEKEQAPIPAGPTGFGVRLLASLLERWR